MQNLAKKPRTKAKFYLGRRTNPQLSKPYFKEYGQLTQKEAREKGKPLYGYMDLIPFDTDEELQAAIAEKRAAGYTVHAKI